MSAGHTQHKIGGPEGTDWANVRWDGGGMRKRKDCGEKEDERRKARKRNKK